MKAQHPLTPRFLVELTAVLLLLAGFLLYLPRITSEGYLGLDSDQYAEFADAIREGKLFRTHREGGMSIGEQLRSPGYPLILAATGAILGGHSGQHFVITHFVLTLAAFVALAVAFRPWIRPVLLFFPMAICLWQLREFFNAHMSEWSALCGLFTLFALTVSYLRTYSASLLTGTGLITACTILIRPALLGIGILPVILCALRPTKRHTSALVLSLSPLWLWTAINTYRLDSMTLAAKDGFALIYGAPFLGAASGAPESGDDAAFYALMNQRAARAKDSELCCQLGIPNQILIKKGGSNAELALGWWGERFPWLQLNDLMRKYSLGVITAHPLRYARFVMGGFFSLLPSALLLLPGFCVAFLLLRTSSLRPLGWTTIFASALHLCHLGGILLTQPLLPRYVSLTLYPAITMSLIAAIPWAREAFAKRSNP